MKSIFFVSIIATLLVANLYSQPSYVFVDYPASNLWKATTSESQNWYSLNFNESSWSNAQSIESIESPPRIIAPNSRNASTAYFRGELNFTYEKLPSIERVLILIEANTSFDLYFNGKNCGSDPDWPNGPLKVYDVTNFFNSSGKNVVAIKSWCINSTQPSVYCIVRIEYPSSIVE